MKRAGICLWMMIKRMAKHPAYWILLLLFPAAVFVVPGFNEAVKEEEILVGYVIGRAVEETEPMQVNGAESTEGEVAVREQMGDDAEWNGNGTGMDKYSERLFAAIECKLADDGLFQYIKYTDDEKMKEDIMTGKLSCGVVFDDEFAENLRAQDYYHCIALYLPEGMNVGGMVQEDLFQRVYQAYSAVWYAELLNQQGYQTEPDVVLRKFSEYQEEGKVFVVDYEISGKKKGEFHGDSEIESEASAISLRGILAFLTLLSASLGALDGSRDRKRNLGKGIASPGALGMTATGAPILLAALFLAGGMVFSNMKMTYMSEIEVRAEGVTGEVAEELMKMAGRAPVGLIWAEILPEFVSALLYGFALWLFAMVAGRLLSEKLMAQVMPCFIILVLLCCPVFWDLGETIPMVGYLSKLFPITWYMKFWG